MFRIFWCKMKITQAEAPSSRMDCQTNWCPHLCHPHHFYARCPFWRNPPNLFWFGTGTKYAGLHAQWLGCVHTKAVVAMSCSKWWMPNVTWCDRWVQLDSQQLLLSDCSVQPCCAVYIYVCIYVCVVGLVFDWVNVVRSVLERHRLSLNHVSSFVTGRLLTRR